MVAYIELVGQAWRVRLPDGQVVRFPLPEGAGNVYSRALLAAPDLFRQLREMGVVEVVPTGWTRAGREPAAAWLLCHAKKAGRLEGARRRCLKILRVHGADQQSLDL